MLPIFGKAEEASRADDAAADDNRSELGKLFHGVLLSGSAGQVGAGSR
ncbi:hypothetical protein PSYAR_13529 [Pseudomonas syringae pv. aceris str. M302273]|nr:hypothetical protein PSYAR_13529 [Pseudomonas syringae pv. aceris str. M302273]